MGIHSPLGSLVCSSLCSCPWYWIFRWKGIYGFFLFVFFKKRQRRLECARISHVTNVSIYTHAQVYRHVWCSHIKVAGCHFLQSACSTSDGCISRALPLTNTHQIVKEASMIRGAEGDTTLTCLLWRCVNLFCASLEPDPLPCELLQLHSVCLQQIELLLIFVCCNCQDHTSAWHNSVVCTRALHVLYMRERERETCYSTACCCCCCCFRCQLWITPHHHTCIWWSRGTLGSRSGPDIGDGKFEICGCCDAAACRADDYVHTLDLSIDVVAVDDDCLLIGGPWGGFDCAVFVCVFVVLHVIYVLPNDKFHISALSLFFFLYCHHCNNNNNSSYCYCCNYCYYCNYCY